MDLKINEKLLSICIPTRGRVDIMHNTLKSIYISDADLLEFEVVIYDSSDNDELYNLITSEFNYPNLIYKSGVNNGFLNLITALQLGNGAFLKLQNDYACFNERGLEKLLNIIKENLSNKSVFFFGNNNIDKINRYQFDQFDQFLNEISFFCTWSTTFGIWKEDFEKLKKIDINPMFPHTSFLLALNYKKQFYIFNENLFHNQEVSKKGGYNLFRTFSVDFLDMLKDSLKNYQITKHTFIHIKTHLYNSFLVQWYYSTKVKKNEYTFDLTNIKQSMNVHYNNYYYFKMYFLGWIVFPFRGFCKKIVINTLTFFSLIKKK